MRSDVRGPFSITVRGVILALFRAAGVAIRCRITIFSALKRAPGRFKNKHYC